MINSNLINSVLCSINPKIPLTPTHYVCGSNLALFTSFAQIENCLTGFSNTCKSLACNYNLPISRNNEKM